MPSPTDSHRLCSKILKFFEFGRSLAQLSTCRRLSVGVVVFPPDCTAVYAIGYNGPVRGLDNDGCSDKADQCGCAHAETNAVIKLDRDARAILFSTHAPCWRCANAIINSGRIVAVVYDSLYRDARGLDLLIQAGILVDISTDVINYAKVQEWWQACTSRK